MDRDAFGEFLIDLSKKLIESLSIHIGSGDPGAKPLVRGSKNIAPFNVDREAFNEFFRPENSSNG